MYKKSSYHTYALVVLSVVVLAGSAAMVGAATPDPGPPLSSSFPGPMWAVVTPVGGTVSVANAHLLLNVPGGSNHDALRPANQQANQAVRVVQPIGNVDFDVSIKIDSPVVATDTGTSRGLMVLADDKNFITFALVTDGKNISLSANTVTNGVAAAVSNDAVFHEYQSPMYLRITRAGSVYNTYYSVDGNVWTLAATFHDTSVPTSIGPFAGNYNGTPARAVPVTMSINWFDIL
jgi:hypothetical protein